MLIYPGWGFLRWLWGSERKAKEWTEAGLRERWGHGAVRARDEVVGSASDGRILRVGMWEGCRVGSLIWDCRGFYSWADKSQELERDSRELESQDIGRIIYVDTEFALRTWSLSSYFLISFAAVGLITCLVFLLATVSCLFFHRFCFLVLSALWDFLCVVFHSIYCIYNFSHYISHFPEFFLASD